MLATRDRGYFPPFLNACRHRSVKVATAARGKQNVFLCPFHHWSYASSGSCFLFQTSRILDPWTRPVMALLNFLRWKGMGSFGFTLRLMAILM